MSIARRELFVRIASLAAIGASLVSTSPAEAHEHCKTVTGDLSSHAVPVPPCDSGVGLCTEGTLTGTFKSTFDFTGDTFTVSDPTIPMFHYTGLDVFTRSDGSTVVGESNGSVNGADGALVDLITITGGTGHWADATGFLLVVGSFDLATGTGHSTYVGQICRADQDDHDDD